MNVNKIKITTEDGVIYASSGDILSEVIGGEKPCGGHGKCGKCKFFVSGAVSEISDSERALLTPCEIEDGLRLSCMTRVYGDCSVRLCGGADSLRILTDASLPEIEIKPTFLKYGVAVDIGTTTVAARLYDVSGKLLSEKACINPQSALGADVITRIEAAEKGEAKKLRALILDALSQLVLDLAEEAEISADDIDCATVTGNTVMLSLLCGENVSPLARAPFEAKRLFGETVSAGELGLKALNEQARIILSPCISAFVGADTVCAILATKLTEKDGSVLVDIGTNGEMAVWRNGKLTACSTAAGPAFEGVGISMGMRGAVGAVDKVYLADGRVQAHTIGDIAPVGICGSGLIDAAACMLETGAMDEDGFIDENFAVSGEVGINQSDVRMLQLAKSAICAGIATLLLEGGSAQGFDGSFYIAGGFGNYLNIENAARIGLIPRVVAEKAVSVGNAALGGASMILLNADMAEEAKKTAREAEVLDLTGSREFADRYVSSMSFCEL